MKFGDTARVRWECTGAVVRGAAHIKQDKICQDALYIHGAKPLPIKNPVTKPRAIRPLSAETQIAAAPLPDCVPLPAYALACVADGHGSDRCPFSDEGAKTAVAIAADILAELLESDNPLETITAHKDIRLPRLLETRWKEAVAAIHAQKLENLAKQAANVQAKNGIANEQVISRQVKNEQATNSNEERAASDDSISLPPFSYELYGTTLLALAVTDGFVFALQIGDGDAVAIDTDGKARWLIPPTDHAGNETESLCMENAWQYVRAQLIPTTQAPSFDVNAVEASDVTADEASDIIVDEASNSGSAPLMYLLSTDGYANSFTTGEGFLKVGADIFRLWRENGRAYIEENLSDWLVQTSADGSGDDIAVAVIFCTAADSVAKVHK